MMVASKAATTLAMTSERVRLRLVFDDRQMLSKSKKKEGLKRCWFLLKPHLNTISDLASHLQNAFRLHRTCPHGITFSMDGFVLPYFESTCILKDKDIVCVKRRGSIANDGKHSMLPSAIHENGAIELPKLLAVEGFQEERGGYETMSQDDGDDQSEEVVHVEAKSNGNVVSKKRKASKKLNSPSTDNSLSQEERGGYETVFLDDDNDQSEDVVHLESKSDGNEISKKRKASKKLKSPSKKKIKMSTTENLAVIPEVHDEENGSFDGPTHHQLSPAKKHIGKSSNQLNKSSNPAAIKQKNDKSGPKSAEARSPEPQDEGETKKLPSRSARRKKAKRRWLRELKLEKEKLEKEKLHPSPVLEKDGQQLPITDTIAVPDVHQQLPIKDNCVASDVHQQLPIKDNGCIVSDVHQQSDEESEEADDMVPVEIRPGHIRFQPRGKDQPVLQNQFPVETFQWNGITSKKKGQKWGKERNSSHKQEESEQSGQDRPSVQNAEKKHTFDAIDFEKLAPYTSLPKEGDVIAYRLIELSSSWTPELSSFRVGKISQYDAKSNMIWLDRVLEYPFEFEKKIDGDVSLAESDPYPYQEDGSLVINYASLADVRIIKHGRSVLATGVASSSALVTPTKASSRDLVTPTKATNSSTDEQFVADQTVVASSKQQTEGHNPAKENGELNVWDEINNALEAKKANLSRKDVWKKEESSGSGSRSWSQRAMRCSALGPTMARLRSQNGL